MERDGFLRRVADKEGLLCMITDLVDEEVLDGAPRIRMIANFGVGYDNIDLRAATDRRIPVSNTPGVLTDATADLAFALMLAVARRVVEGDERVRGGEFRFWAPLHFLGRDVSGKTLGIIGLGKIGRAVAMRAKGFGMRILYSSRHRLGKQEEESLGVIYSELGPLLREADFVSLHVPLTHETRHLIGARELKVMKPTAYLINTARGPVVDEGALEKALHEQEIAGAGLDVYEGEPSVSDGLKGLDNVVLLPHVGSATLETRTKMALMAAENLISGLAGKRPPNCLNWEEIS
jgi:glyoxylate reductase